MTTGGTQRRPTGWRADAVRTAAIGLLTGAALLFNQSAVHWRPNINDSHYYAYCGWRVSQGARPYLDVWNNKPPGTWWVNTLGCYICGPGLGRELLICSAAVAIAIVGFVAVARTAYHRSLWLAALATGCVLLTHLRYECGGNRTETFVVPCEILAVLGYLRWRRSGRLRWLVFGGLFAGAAPLFKQSGLAALGACALHLAWSQLSRRRVGAERDPAKPWWVPWVVAGAAAATLPGIAAAALAAQGALGEAYFAIWKFNRAYFAVNDATWLGSRGAFAPYWAELPPLYGLYVVAGVGLVLAALRSWVRVGPTVAAGVGREGVGVFWLWLLVAFYLACVGPGRLAYHLATTLAPLGLLALYPLHWLLGGGDLGRRIVARPSMAVVVVIYLWVLLGVGDDSVGVARRCWLQKPHWYALRRKHPAPYEVQAAEIKRRTRPHDTIYVWGWSPGTYRFAYRHSPSRFATLEKLGQVGQFAQFIIDGAIADIRRGPPAMFVISVGDLRALLAPPRSAFAQWVDRHYRDLGNFEGMHILTWRE
ncbi:MAG: glycosyltransferase family 39 protein [Phycisphaerae bacterium]